MLQNGTVKSTIVLGFLLFEGIEDTICISLVSDLTEKVRVVFYILRDL